MKLIIVLTTVWAASVLAFPASAADTAAAPNGPARSASQPMGSSPAVRAAENAELPGDLRPEERIVPQISIPLKRRGVASPARGASAASGKNGIDDDAARCSAKKTKAERDDCLRPTLRAGPAAIKP